MLLSPGDTSQVLLWGGHTFYAPRLLIDELHTPEIQRRTKLPRETVERVLVTVLRYVTIVEHEEFQDRMDRAKAFFAHVHALISTSDKS